MIIIMIPNSYPESTPPLPPGPDLLYELLRPPLFNNRNVSVIITDIRPLN